MSTNWYFGRDADVVNGASNFSTRISATPLLFGLTALQASAFAALAGVLQSSYSAAIEPSTRTPVAIQAKNVARKNVVNSAKLLAKIIYATASVTDVQLTDLGLLPRPTYNPAPPLEGSPSVEIMSVNGRLVKVRLHNPLEETSRSFPKGVAGANIYTFVGEDSPPTPDAFFLHGMTTRTITELMFPLSVPNGSKVWISAFWISTRGEYGIGSQPTSFILQGGEAAPGKMAA